MLPLCRFHAPAALAGPPRPREKLLDMDIDDWTNEIERLIPSYGRTMTESATIEFENGTIDKRHYLLMTGGGGGGH